MKKIFFLIFIFASHILLAKTHQGEIQKIKPNGDEDYIIIYEPYSEAPSKSYKGQEAKFLRVKLNIYDNIMLEGVPAFTVTQDTISFGKENYKTSDSFIRPCIPLCNKYNFIPIDFVRVYLQSLALAVKEYRNGIARVEHRGKSFFFKLNLDDTNKRYEWKTITKNENIKKILDQDIDYITFKSEIKNCSTKKDLNCLKPYLDNSNSVDLIKTEVLKRGVYNDANLCKQFKEMINTSSEGIGLDDVPDVLTKSIKNIDFFWEKLATSLEFSKDIDSRELQIKDFGKVYVYIIDKDLNPPSSCLDQSKDIYLVLIKEKQKWKIVSVVLHGFSY